MLALGLIGFVFLRPAGRNIRISLRKKRGCGDLPVLGIGSVLHKRLLDSWQAGQDRRVGEAKLRSPDPDRLEFRLRFNVVGIGVFVVFV